MLMDSVTVADSPMPTESPRGSVKAADSPMETGWEMPMDSDSVTRLASGGSLLAHLTSVFSGLILPTFDREVKGKMIGCSDFTHFPGGVVLLERQEQRCRASACHCMTAAPVRCGSPRDVNASRQAVPMGRQRREPANALLDERGLVR